MSEVNECCKNPDNLAVIEQREDKVQGATMTVRQCQVCQRKHYEMLIDPIPLKTEITGLGPSV